MAVIVDIDGTLLIQGVNPNRSLIAEVNQTPDAYLVTGRQESERARTIAALKAAGIKYEGLLMNGIGPSPAQQLQSKIMNARKLMKIHDVTAAVDDDGMARAAYKKLGIPNVASP